LSSQVGSLPEQVVKTILILHRLPPDTPRRSGRPIVTVASPTPGQDRLPEALARSTSGTAASSVRGGGAAGRLVGQPESSKIRSLPFRERNMMSNKPHLRPHQKIRQAGRMTRLLVAIFFITLFALATALAASGRVAPHGRFIPLSRGRSR
jgi:hypothetical protein